MSVSILIPAFRPTYLRQTIASALTQGLEDFELVISDDSGGDELKPIVERFGDPRIRFVRTAGRTGAGANCRSLWAEARHDRLLFLLDDDLLMPHAVPMMAEQLDLNPEASFCYGQRWGIDERGRVISKPPPANVEVATESHASLVRTLVGGVQNLIGEMSGVLLNRAIGLTVEDFLTYRGRDLKVVGDVACFLNCSAKGPVKAVGVSVASFRTHSAQSSSPDFNPILAIGIGEWELFLRGEFEDGDLTVEKALAAADRLEKGYRYWAPRYPALERLMIPSVEDFRQAVRTGRRDVYDIAFLDRWAAFEAEIEGGK